MIEIRWREMPPLSVRWIAPTPMGQAVAVRPKASGLTAVFGPPGRDGLAGPGFLYTQTSPSGEWVVNHNSGFRPDVTVFSPGGVEVSATVTHVSSNQVRIVFAAPQTGSVRCI